MSQMETVRYDFQVVWLPDDRIIAMGGFNGRTRLDTVEMLTHERAFDDKTTGKWRQCSSMLTARDDFAAVVLRDELVLVAGGHDVGMRLNSVELFTPPAVGDLHALGQWTNLQPMQSVPGSTCNGVFSDGVVFIVGIYFFFVLLVSRYFHQKQDKIA